MPKNNDKNKSRNKASHRLNCECLCLYVVFTLAHAFIINENVTESGLIPVTASMNSVSTYLDIFNKNHALNRRSLKKE